MRAPARAAPCRTNVPSPLSPQQLCCATRPRPCRTDRWRGRTSAGAPASATAARPATSSPTRPSCPARAAGCGGATRPSAWVSPPSPQAQRGGPGPVWETRASLGGPGPAWGLSGPPRLRIGPRVAHTVGVCSVRQTTARTARGGLSPWPHTGLRLAQRPHGNGVSRSPGQRARTLSTPAPACRPQLCSAGTRARPPRAISVAKASRTGPRSPSSAELPSSWWGRRGGRARRTARGAACSPPASVRPAPEGPGDDDLSL